jgi:hypothetical protein
MCVTLVARHRQSSPPSRADARQVVPAVPYRVVFNDELRGDRCAEAQGEGRRLVQLFIRERAYRGGRLTTVPTQEFECGGLRYPCLVVGMLRIQLGDNLPRDVRSGLAAGDCSREINLNRVDAGNMVHDDADRTAVPPTFRDWCTPLLFRESFNKGGQAGSPYLDAISQ